MGHIFSDNQGRRWTIEINTATIKRVKSLLGVNILEAVGGDLLDRIAADPALLGDVLFALVKPQADEAKVTDEGFGCALAGDAIEEASQAFVSELIAFFPKAKRGLLQRATDARRELGEATLRMAEKKLDAALADARASMPTESGASSMNAPELQG